ncbi:MAG: thioredoxin domain-containing protein [Elusimicrobia bacterium]|nr:thioredoxin domain-containing protein [Elusimicrobiota bacterium]
MRLLEKKNVRLIASGLVLSVFFIACVKLGRKTEWAAAMALPEGRVRGPIGAPITIEEFSDFQCPSCKRAQPVLHELMSLYPNDVKLVFKHFPLEMMHASARLAAKATECARRKNKFWEYHDTLFERQEVWSKSQNVRDDFLVYAKELALNEAEFNGCLDDAKINLAVSADAAEAQSRQVESTPTFFLEGVRLVGGGQLKQHGARLIEVMKSEKTKGKRRP